MVLRGSKIHPDHIDVFELEKHVHQLQHYLKTIQEQESCIGQEIADLVHEDLEKFRHSEKEAKIELPSTLAKSIKVLISRLEYLESEKKQSDQELHQYQKQLLMSLKQFLCGGLAGMVARSIVAPIDRVKLLIQTGNTNNAVSRSIIGTFKHEIKENGIKCMWKGNVINCIRVFPYAACQFSIYARAKLHIMEWTESNGREFGFLERLMSGAIAGSVAATITYPLDVMRIRQTVFHEISNPREAFMHIKNECGFRGFYKGWTPTVLSLGPFIATNFAIFDYLRSTYIPGGDKENASTLLVLGLGAVAGISAQSVCYPLDTIRRNIQVGNKYNSILQCVSSIWKERGITGFYKGIIPNACKIIPNNGIRFLAYTKLTQWLKTKDKCS